MKFQVQVFEIGERYGRWTVVERRDHGGQPVRCRCECGTEREIKRASVLTTGRSRSCGCLSVDLLVARSLKHGGAIGKPNRTYRVWQGMLGRCTNPTDRAYPRYGGRGITVCDRWLHSFSNFRADMGDAPNDMTLDRMNNNLGYSPDNCRWADWVTQNNNRRKGVQPGSLRTECPMGHQLKPPNLVQHKHARGQRNCLACARARSWCWRYPNDDLTVVAARYYDAILADRKGVA